jgi:hypothetical protein
MRNFFIYLLAWSEIWAPLIPLAIIIFFYTRTPLIYPLVLYVIIALILNILSTLISLYINHMPSFIKSNSFIYHIHSVARVILFSWYISKVKIIRSVLFQRSILILYLLTASVLIFTYPYELLSSYLFAAESITLLLLCILFFINLMYEDSRTNWVRHPAFFMIAGIIQFEIILFFTFSFLQFFSDEEFAWGALKTYSISFIILCIIIAITIYRSSGEKKQTKIPVYK